MRAYLRHLPLPARVLLGASALLAVLPVLDVVRQAPALGLSEDARGWVYVLVLGLAAAACAERVRRRPEERAGWLLISAGLALWVLAQAWWQVALSGLEEPPYPSTADGLWLSAYVLFALGTLALARSRVGSVPRVRMLDAAIAALVLAAAGSAVVVDAVLDASEGLTGLGLATNLAYPLLDIVLLAVLAAAVAAAGWRVGSASWPLVAGIALLGLSDSIYAYQVAIGSYGSWEPVDLGWIVAFLAVGVAAWQPVPALAPAPPRWRGQAVPAVLSAAMLALLIGDHFARVGRVTLAFAGLVLAAAIARMSLAVGALERVNTELEQARREAERRARVDPLTGLLNRRELGEQARLVLAGAPPGTAGLALIDVDHFKLVNDRHGHLAGDRVLRAIASRIAGAAGPTGLPARWGGEEFCVLLTGLQGAADLRARCERLRRALCEEPVPLGPSGVVRVTCSVGAARTLGQPGEDRLEHLLHRSDRALYAAKARGRNTTVLDGDGARRADVARRRAAAGADPPAVADLASAVAERLDLPAEAVQRCRLAGLVHDVARVAALAAARSAGEPQQGAVRAAVGDALARESLVFAGISDVIRHHDERVDGGGYPDGLRGEEIPVESRVLAACGTYVELVTGCHGEPWTDEDALDEVRLGAGSRFDPRVVAALAAEVEAPDARVRGSAA